MRMYIHMYYDGIFGSERDYTFIHTILESLDSIKQTLVAVNSKRYHPKNFPKLHKLFQIAGKYFSFGESEKPKIQKQSDMLIALGADAKVIKKHIELERKAGL